MSEWIPCYQQLPDDEITVLIFSPLSESAPVWMGYMEADRWFEVNGAPVTVTHWMHLPAGPEQ